MRILNRLLTLLLSNLSGGGWGQTRRLLLELQLIADVGLIGLPNAGKSSLLNSLTRASVRVANYPFTTLEPNLGALNGLILADIPGLIEGASTGRGLGHKFLKHIRRTKILVHCISCESDDVMRDYQTVRKELELFDPELTKKPELILITKTDLVDEKVAKKLLKKLTVKGLKVILCSIYREEVLRRLISEFIQSGTN